MEHSQKNTDCYFFYYSTCKKGDICPFRHEPAALGCEIMCRYWQQGNCIDEHCNYRHMELKKNRKLIPCYWENQPSGCKKPHCSFMHKMARATGNDPINPVKISDLPSKPVNQEWSSHQKETKYGGSSTESDQGRGSSEASSFIGSPAVDPLIVKFEKESDSESVPSPVKPQQRVPYCKTYEEIRLEEIQAESAAYYSYEVPTEEQSNAGKIKTAKPSRKVLAYPKIVKEKNEEDSKGLNFEVLTLEEIRRRRMGKALQEGTKLKSTEPVTEEDDSQKDFLKDAIKTLAELKAERSSKGVKRSVEDSEIDISSDEPPVKCRVTETSISPSKVPPVRLRRSGKRMAPAEWEGQNVHKDLHTENTGNNRLPDPIDRLNTDSNTSPPSEESLHTSKKSDVEVRLCDSSTDETKEEDRKSVGTDTTDDCTAKATHLSYENLLNINEDDYLSLDTTSADILKDIDALLTEKEGTL